MSRNSIYTLELIIRTLIFTSLLDLDSEQLDKTGIDLGATGRLALMAKLAQGTGMQLPQAANQALNSAVMQVTLKLFLLTDSKCIYL